MSSEHQALAQRALTTRLGEAETPYSLQNVMQLSIDRSRVSRPHGSQASERAVGNCSRLLNEAQIKAPHAVIHRLLQGAFMWLRFGRQAVGNCREYHFPDYLSATWDLAYSSSGH